MSSPLFPYSVPPKVSSPQVPPPHPPSTSTTYPLGSSPQSTLTSLRETLNYLPEESSEELPEKIAPESLRNWKEKATSPTLYDFYERQRSLSGNTAIENKDSLFKANPEELAKNYSNFCQDIAEYLAKSPNNLCILYFHFESQDKRCMEYLDAVGTNISHWEKDFPDDVSGLMEELAYKITLKRFEPDARLYFKTRGKESDPRKIQVEIEQILHDHYFYRPIAQKISLKEPPLYPGVFNPYQRLSGTVEPAKALYEIPGAGHLIYEKANAELITKKSIKVFNRSKVSPLIISEDKSQALEKLTQYIFQHNVTAIYITEESMYTTTKNLNNFIGVSVEAANLDNLDKKLQFTLNINKIPSNDRYKVQQALTQFIDEASIDRDKQMVLWFINMCNERGDIGLRNSSCSTFWQFCQLPPKIFPHNLLESFTKLRISPPLLMPNNPNQVYSCTSDEYTPPESSIHIGSSYAMNSNSWSWPSMYEKKHP